MFSILLMMIASFAPAQDAVPPPVDRPRGGLSVEPPPRTLPPPPVPTPAERLPVRATDASSVPAPPIRVPFPAASVAVPRGSPGRWIISDDYPLISILMWEEGVSQFRVTVSPNGRVSDCTILSSSGFPRLDRATCRSVTRRARFTPAMAGDRPVEGTYSQNVNWSIDQDSVLKASSFSWKRPKTAIEEKARGRVRFQASVGVDGKVSNCKILRSSGFISLDTETCRQIEALTGQTPNLNGAAGPQPRLVVSQNRVVTQFYRAVDL